MNKIGLADVVSRIIMSQEPVVVSLAPWDFHVEWEPEVFRDIVGELVWQEGSVEDGDLGQIGRLGFFRLLELATREQVERLARYPAARLFVSGTSKFFFCNLPTDLRGAISQLNELSDEVLSSACLMADYSWLILRDGDEGDAYYYLFEMHKESSNQDT